MKTHILRLGSVVKDGVGGPAAGLIDLIYSFLLQEYGIADYRYILINQIGDDLDEGIVRMGKGEIGIKIKYPTIDNFEKLELDFKNKYRLDIVHKALLSLNEFDKKNNESKLEAIRNRILEQNFRFEFILKTIKSRKGTLATLSVVPSTKSFDISLKIIKESHLIKNVIIYVGVTTDSFFKELFSVFKWKSDHVVLISGKDSEITILYDIDQDVIRYLNKYRDIQRAPHFERFKSELNKEVLLKNYIEKLNVDVLNERKIFLESC